MAYFYDGGLAPPRPESMPAEVTMPGSGVMFVGEKGVQISAYYGGNPWAAFVANPTKAQMPRGLPGGYLLPEAKFKDFQQPAPPCSAARSRIITRNGSACARRARSPSRPSNSPAG